MNNTIVDNDGVTNIAADAINIDTQSHRLHSLPSVSGVAIDAVETIKKQKNDTESKDKYRNSIPTAIVKPKYQKSSYDDRQLPPVANVDREKPWYGDADDSTTYTANDHHKIVAALTTTTTKIQQLPHFERKSNKHLKHLTKSVHSQHSGKSSSLSSALSSLSSLSDGRAKEHLNSLLDCDRDDCSSLSASVAIVQPRKKENMENELTLKNIDSIECKGKLVTTKAATTTASPIAITRTAAVTTVAKKIQQSHKKRVATDSDGDSNKEAPRNGRPKNTTAKPRSKASEQDESGMDMKPLEYNIYIYVL